MRRSGAGVSAIALLMISALVLLVGCADGDSEPAPSPAPPAVSASPYPTVPASPGTTSPDTMVPDSPGAGATAAAIVVASTAFTEGEPIPPRYSCRGQNLAPPLTWSGIPGAAAGVALVVDDPDAVGGLYIHWVVTDIPASVTSSPEGGAPAGGRVNANSGGDASYLGPCPPAGSGVHRYRFTVYALSKRLELAGSTSARQAVDAITDAATAQGRLTGTFAG